MVPSELLSFVAACLVMILSLSGVIFTVGKFGLAIQRNLTYLATFAGGVFFIVVFHLLEEALRESSSLALAAGAILFGAALMQALHQLLPDVHHHHSTAHTHSHTFIDGRRVLISDSFHNVGDGVLLAASFSVNWYIGIAALIGIVVHEFVQEISEYFVLREGGFSNREALTRNVLSSATILVGVAIAVFLASADEIAVLFAGIAAGGFLAVLIQDLLPNALQSLKESGKGWKHVLALMVGIVLMIGIQMLTSQQEPHELVHGTETSESGEIALIQTEDKQ